MQFREGILTNLVRKRGQVTIFIILAIFILATVAVFLIYRNSQSVTSQIPQEFQPVYNTFLSCVQSDALTGISTLESQGGYISIPPFQPGSVYMPFSSDLNFLGNPIPYWYYVSGNNIAEQQVPSEQDMQNQLAQLINQNVRNCDFGNFTGQDFQVQMGQPTTSVTINQDQVQINLDMSLNMSRGNDTTFVRNHKVEINSELGNLYQTALTVYNYEQQSLFLENYTIDVLRNYAPVDGVDISCSPRIWDAGGIVENLSQAIQDNIDSIRSGTNTTNYFTLKIPVQGVRFLTSSNWSSEYEINPSQGNLLMAQPVGDQAGLGILGFCYVPYHFVYDVKYPVLAIVQKNGEIFQFPMAVIIEGNEPRSPLNGTAISSSSPELCNYENTNMNVSVFDSNSNPINANISYECLGETCNIGQTSSGGSLSAPFPQCDNGYVLASAAGYATGRSEFSTTQSGSLNMILNKLYNLPVNLQIGGNIYNGDATITFTSSDGTSQTLVYPQQTNVNLSEGNYEVQVYVYQNSSINVGATTNQQCVNVAASGLAGVLGVTQPQCFNVTIPAQVISDALSGGGQSDFFALASNLQSSKSITINAPSLPTPTSLEQLQNNYILFTNENLTIGLT
ncbi:MAG: hypothetical protein WAU65_00085 [Candidatus Nanoarchaeia archaeon]